MENKDLNRYEEQPAKENMFVKVLKMFLQYLKNLGYDFITSFKYNNMKLASILVAVPGVIFGFFLNAHSAVLAKLQFSREEIVITEEFFGTVEVFAPGMPFNFSGILIFIMMLCGILNLFNSVTLSGKKNLGTVVMCTIWTAVFIIAGALYFYSIFYYKSLCDTKWVPKDFAFTGDMIFSLITVILSAIAAVAGCVLGFIRYDRTYEKVDR